MSVYVCVGVNVYVDAPVHLDATLGVAVLGSNHDHGSDHAHCYVQVHERGYDHRL